MVRITNGTQELEVSKGAFKSMFAPLGYHLISEPDILEEESQVGEDNSYTQAPEESLEDYKEPDEDSEVDKEEKPLSEMTFEELKFKAAELGIKANGLKSRREVIEAISNEE